MSQPAKSLSAALASCKLVGFLANGATKDNAAKIGSSKIGGVKPPAPPAAGLTKDSSAKIGTVKPGINNGPL